jgi:hypothetical protein
MTSDSVCQCVVNFDIFGRNLKRPASGQAKAEYTGQSDILLKSHLAHFAINLSGKYEEWTVTLFDKATY